MNDLITRVAEKAGITQEQARTAVETVAVRIKEMLPAPFAEQIDGLLGGEGHSLGDAIKDLRAAMGS